MANGTLLGEGAEFEGFELHPVFNWVNLKQIRKRLVILFWDS